jgi:ATP-dependent helicase/DNAse subunit B
MRPRLLVTGPPGSGKTTAVLERLRAALRAGPAGARLLVPTATLARHFENLLAREGFLLRRGMVDTLAHFVGARAEDLPQASAAVLYLAVEQAARRLSRPEFARVAGMPGFSAALARTIEGLSSAGCTAARLAAHLPDAPLAEAFLAVYRHVERELEGRGLALRARRLEVVAGRIRSDGLAGIDAVWLDGFHALPDPELALIEALAQHAEVAVTLPDGEHTRPVLERLLGMGFVQQHLAPRRAEPERQLVKAPTLEREAAEIARRILDHAAAGRPFREMGVIVRTPSIYEPVLRAAFARFSIPARFYFDRRLDAQGVARFLCGAVEAMLDGWEHAATLAVLRRAPRLLTLAAMDRFDHDVRAQLPGAGLGALVALAEDRDRSGSVARVLHQFEELEWLRPLELAPPDWATHLKSLRQLYRPARPAAGASHEDAVAWRAQAAALDAFDRALDDTASAIGPTASMKLAAFWRMFEAVLRLTPLRVDDDRRDVVQVLSAPEARQWVLPVVFVCGMVEKQFPAAPPPDPIFPHAARLRLNAAGIRVRTAESARIDERALFDAALTRATEMVTLSYPEFDERGGRHLPSIYLEDLRLPPASALPVRPAGIPPAEAAPPAVIASADLLGLLEARAASLAVTSLERFRQCPFQFFAASTLRLKPPPPRPEERLDALLQGTIVHAVLEAWYRQKQPMAPLAGRIFDELCEECRVPSGYRRQAARDAMLLDLAAFAEDATWPREEFTSRLEETFSLPLGEAVTVTGKIDRLDQDAAGRAFVLDYKYSAKARNTKRLQDQTVLQPALYLLAARRVFGLQPAGMYYVGLRGDVSYAGWAAEGAPLKRQPLSEDWLAQGEAAAIEAVRGIRAGRAEPAPADIDKCGYCDFADVCRYARAAEAVAAAGGGEP